MLVQSVMLNGKTANVILEMFYFRFYRIIMDSS